MTQTLRLAGFFTRAVALAVDGAIVTAGAVVIGGGVALALSLFDVHVSSTPLRAALGTGGWLLAVTVYFVSFWTLTGETPGMRFMGIRVVATRGGLPSRAQALRRFVGMLVCAIPVGAGFLFVLVDDRRRGLHDRLAGTLVVHRAGVRLPAPELPQPEAVAAAADVPRETPLAHAMRARSQEG
jgi:uncharacterized RDD family membrane protein YckC